MGLDLGVFKEPVKLGVAGVKVLLPYENSVSLPYDESVRLPSLGVALLVRWKVSRPRSGVFSLEPLGCLGVRPGRASLTSSSSFSKFS